MSREDRKRQRKARRAAESDTPSADELAALAETQRRELQQCWTEVAGLRAERDRLNAQNARLREEVEERNLAVHAGLATMRTMHATEQQLRRELLQLAHPDKHPAERQALATRATQWLTANKPA